eukprot:1187221-Prorocentrum_minimum.AAC.6
MSLCLFLTSCAARADVYRFVCLLRGAPALTSARVRATYISEECARAYVLPRAERCMLLFIIIMRKDA